MQKRFIILIFTLFFFILEAQTIRILGVMTGTSCDGLDATCVETGENHWKVLWSDSTPYPNNLKNKMFDIQVSGKQVSLKEFLHLNRDLSEWYGKTLADLITQHEKKPDVIANHGQTVAHFPAENRLGTTLQLGDPTRIACLTELTVVSNFREGDQAAGGDGAPLAPLFHKFLAKQITQANGVSIHNIGGISNFSYFGPGDVSIAFDTGPGNVLIDAATNFVTHGEKQFDEGGKFALSSSPDEKALKILLEHPYFKQAPPKSTGRDDFPPEQFFNNTPSALVATATALTVETIALAYEDWITSKGLPLELILLCGGGAKNLAIIQGLQNRLPKTSIKTLEDFGIDPQYIETQAFALLGFYSLLGKPLGGPWSNAKKFAPPGHITPGKNWNQVLEKLKKYVSVLAPKNQ